jgi:hypothetical protein
MNEFRLSSKLTNLHKIPSASALFWKLGLDFSLLPLETTALFIRSILI